MNNYQKALYARQFLNGELCWNYGFDSDLSFIEKYAQVIKNISTVIKVGKYAKKLSDLRETVDGFFEDNHYWESNTKYLSVDCKVYSFGELEYVLNEIRIKKHKLSKRRRTIIEEKFTDNYIWDLWTDWIECERDQLIYELSDEDVWESEKAKEYIRLLGLKHSGKNQNCWFFGSNGGHFCIETDLERWMENAEDEFNTLIEEDFDYISEHLNNGWINDVERLLEAVQWCFDFVKKYVSNMDFNEELKYRVEDFIENEF